MNVMLSCMHECHVSNPFWSMELWIHPCFNPFLINVTLNPHPWGMTSLAIHELNLALQSHLIISCLVLNLVSFKRFLKCVQVFFLFWRNFATFWQRNWENYGNFFSNVNWTNFAFFLGLNFAKFSIWKKKKTLIL